MKKKIEKNDNKIKKLLETDIKNKIMIIVSIIIIVLIILITVLNKQKTITCKLYEDQSSNNYTRDTTYTITAKRNTVQSIKINQLFKSRNTTFLAYFENEEAKKYKDVKGYTYDSKINKDNYVVNVSIDFKQIDLDNFVKDNDSIKDEIKKNKPLTLESAKKFYEDMGATCK